jgi:IS30 family transposase
VTKYLTAELRSEVFRLAKEGRSYTEIAEIVGRHRGNVCDILQRPLTKAVAPMVWRLERSGPCLSMAEREEIRVGLARKETLTAIAARIGRATSTVSREVKAGGGPKRYLATAAHRRAFERSRRPKTPKLAQHPKLAAQVTDWLQELWSPEKISGRLRLEFPDDPMMRVSHETIYQSLFVQGRGELRRELHRCLRSGRAQRRPRHRLEKRGQIPNKVMISERSAEESDRAVVGSWEGDLVIGANGKSAIGTLVERASRYVILLALPDGHTAEHVRLAMMREIQRLPAALFKTITWDQGKEMSEHAKFTIDTGIQIYFCDPHSPWQRGSNENTNGLLRDYMPKGMDLSPLTQDNLDYIAASLNDRPRQTLGYMKPWEKLAELVATTP